MTLIYHEPFKVWLIYENFKEFFPAPPCLSIDRNADGCSSNRHNLTADRASFQNPENCVDKLTVVSGVSSPSSFAPGR